MNAHSCLIRRVLVLAAVALCVLPAAASAQPTKWWQNEGVQRKLSLTPDQSQRIEDIFQAALPDQRRLKRQLDELERELGGALEHDPDEATLVQQVDRIEHARAELNKARTLMLLRIRRVLSADQRQKLSMIHKDFERERSERRKSLTK
jgi:Spy/CpxP family protein refolding chaperone